MYEVTRRSWHALAELVLAGPQYRRSGTIRLRVVPGGFATVAAPGVSLGDGYLAEPYAYVGPWQPRTGPFWNAPFGAARPLRELPDVAGFFAEGRSLTA